MGASEALLGQSWRMSTKEGRSCFIVPLWGSKNQILGALLGALWAILEPFGEPLGLSWGCRGALLGALEALLGALEALLGQSWRTTIKEGGS